MVASLQAPSWLALVKGKSAGANLEEESRREGEGAGLGLHKPLDFLATSEERFSRRLATSNFGNSTITNVQQQLQQQRHCLIDTATIQFYGPGLLKPFGKCSFKMMGATLLVGLPSLGRRKGQVKS